MASHKMTFTLPEDVAVQFLRKVPSQSRSRFVTEAIRAKLREREDQLIKACEAANRDSDVLQIEQDWDGLTDPIEEPWNDASTR